MSLLVWMPVVSALIASSVTAVVTVNLKYAENEREFRDRLKLVAINLASYLMDALVLASLIANSLSREPLTRAVVVTISCQVGALTLSLTIKIFVSLLRQVIVLFGEHLVTTSKLIDVVKRNQELTSNDARVGKPE